MIRNDVYPQCDSLDLGNDISICEGELVALDAGEGYSSYLWNTGSTSQSILITEPGDYWCTVEILDSTYNFVINGTFSAGSLGFQSDYVLNQISLWVEGTYGITTNPNLLHPNFASCVDHTTGTGNLMVINGAPIPNQNVWFESVPVTPNTKYYFSGWFTSVRWENPAVLEMSINGQTVQYLGLSSTTCFWQNFFSEWNSGISTSALLRIVNQNTVQNGNDFGVDDISLFKVCSMTDTISVEYAPEPIINLGADTVLCVGETLILNAGPFFANYIWQDSSQLSTFEVTQPGLYWVNVTNYFGCTGSDTIQIDFNPLPIIDLGNDTIICIGDTLLLNPGSNFSSYIWQDNTTNPTFKVTSEGTYWVIVFNELGCSSSDTIHVYTVPFPEVDLGNDTSFCEADQYLLSPGGGYLSYLWQDNSSDSTFTATETGWYWVTVATECGNNTDSVYLVFNLIPEIELGNDTTICEGNILILNPGNGYSNYFWQDNSTNPTFEVTAPGIYWVMVFNENDCFATDTIQVSFSPLPLIDLGNDMEFCYGEEYLLNPGTGFLSYHWQDNSTGTTFLVYETGWYWVTVTNECAESTDSVFLTFYSLPQPDLGNDTTICFGNMITLNPGSTYSNYFWQDNSTFPFYDVTSQGFYSVTVENIYGCVASDEIYVNVSDPQVNLGSDQEVCNGDSLLLDAGFGFIEYLWQDGSDERYFIASQQGTYIVKVTDNYQCTATDSLELEIIYLPNPWLVHDTSFCSGESIILIAPEGNYRYYWNGLEGENSFSVIEGGTYILTMVNPCDSVTDEINITRYEMPDVDLGDDLSLLPGETIILEAGEGFDSYMWQDGSFQEYFVVSEDNYNPDNSVYFVEAMLDGCKSSDSIKVEFVQVKVPNVITPNGDGQNDIFLPYLEYWHGIDKHKIVILNRWGQLVWESSDFSSGWDGMSNGQTVPDGTYYWILDIYINAKNITQTLKGSVTVLGSRN